MRTWINAILLSIPLWCLIICVCFGATVEYTIDGEKVKVKYTEQGQKQKTVIEIDFTLEELQRKSIELGQFIDNYENELVLMKAHKKEIDKAIKDIE